MNVKPVKNMVNALDATGHTPCTSRHRDNSEAPQNPGGVFLNSRQPLVLIAASKWWSLSARLAAAFVRHGCRVSALCPTGHPLQHLSGLDRIERYEGIRSLSSLSRAIASTPFDLVVPCDDGVVEQLHALHAQEPSQRSVIEGSLGDPQSFALVCSRYRLLATALELGIAVPETRRVLSGRDLALWHKNVAPAAVLKIDGESGGNGVRICASLEESLAAWREFSAPQGFATACKRLAVDRDPLALWTRKSWGKREITMQRVIRGRPANCMVASRSGEIVSLVSVVVLATDGPTGAATIIRRVNDQRMAQAAKLLAKRLRLTGFFGLDFMIEADIPYLIEMNPRCTQLGHLEFANQSSLVGAFSAHLRGEIPPAPVNPTPVDTIALFPQSLQSLDAGGRLPDGSFLDVPANEPGLTAELKLRPWPQRRWAARLYHAIRPLKRNTAIEYGAVAPRSIDRGMSPGIRRAMRTVKET